MEQDVLNRVLEWKYRSDGFFMVMFDSSLNGRIWIKHFKDNCLLFSYINRHQKHQSFLYTVTTEDHCEWGAFAYGQHIVKSCTKNDK